MINNLFTGVAVLSIILSSWVQYEFYIDQREMNNRIIELETKIHEQKLQVNQLKNNQNQFENEVSEAWQVHDDELQMIKVGLGLLK